MTETIYIVEHCGEEFSVLGNLESAVCPECNSRVPGAKVIYEHIRDQKPAKDCHKCCWVASFKYCNCGKVS